MQAVSSHDSADLAFPRPLDDAEIDGVSGGFLWIGVVVGAFAAGVAIRAGIDWVVGKITG